MAPIFAHALSSSSSASPLCLSSHTHSTLQFIFIEYESCTIFHGINHRSIPGLSLFIAAWLLKFTPAMSPAPPPPGTHRPAPPPARAWPCGASAPRSSVPFLGQRTLGNRSGIGCFRSTDQSLLLFPTLWHQGVDLQSFLILNWREMSSGTFRYMYW